MNRLDLKHKLDEMGVNEEEYSLYGILDWDKIILYENYANWEVFYLSERGSRDNLHVFHSEDEACHYIFSLFKKNKIIEEQISNRKVQSLETLAHNGYIEKLPNGSDKLLFSELGTWAFLSLTGYCVNIPKVESKEELFTQLSNHFGGPHVVCNWDVLKSYFQDLSWINKTNIYVVHRDLSFVPSVDLKRYFGIVNETIQFWERRIEHNVYFILSLKEKSRFKDLIRQ